MNQAKEAFLKNEFIPLMRRLQPDTQVKWGVMNAQQMTEHFAETVRMANGRLVLPFNTNEEDLPKMRAFMLSEKPFRENTKNPIMSDVPEPAKKETLAAAIDELEEEMNDFFKIFSNDPDRLSVNPIFGNLSYKENIHLLHKHAIHHLKQFGLID